ncbi:hypothetical protein [Dyadobacter sp. CY326]|uniref:hypothetical protein n=1 Tax=Dyadobacter sp. CY326 TaxID=2907300 RepID=UPI001F1616D0|nr:hypothetical protein [Dyadobacter sp. CY326]MCE7064093.1 hypothetical protein [Dyadobacter sp. CY326]
MKRKHLALGLLLGMTALFVQCKDSGEDLEPDDENELITSVTLTFKEAGTGTVTSFSFKDADGDGGNAATRFDTVALKANTAYTLTVQLLDESKTPVEDITDEVAEESDEHLLIYTPSPATLLTYTYGDKDVNNYPIGLTGTAKAGAAGIGKLKVQLRHQPGAKNGTPTPGSDDVALDFNLKVQ